MEGIPSEFGRIQRVQSVTLQSTLGAAGHVTFASCDQCAGMLATWTAMRNTSPLVRT